MANSKPSVSLFSKELWIFSKVWIFQNPFCLTLEILNKKIPQQMGGGCHDSGCIKKVYDAPKFSTVYVVKWPVLSLQWDNFQKSYEFSQKCEVFKILSVTYWKT